MHKAGEMRQADKGLTEMQEYFDGEKLLIYLKLIGKPLKACDLSYLQFMDSR